MKRREADHSLIWLAVTTLFVAFVLSSASTPTTLADISPRPTPTNTPLPKKTSSSRVRPLKRVQYTRSFIVRWKGHNRSESGVMCYRVHVKRDDEHWRGLMPGCTSLTSTTFTGEWGHWYYFSVSACDRFGNSSSHCEAWPSKPDTKTYLQEPE